MFFGSVGTHFPTPASQASTVAPAKLLDGSGEYVPAGTSNQPALVSPGGWGKITGSRQVPNTLAACVGVGRLAGGIVAEIVGVA